MKTKEILIYLLKSYWEIEDIDKDIFEDNYIVLNKNNYIFCIDSTSSCNISKNNKFLAYKNIKNLKELKELCKKIH